MQLKRGSRLYEEERAIRLQKLEALRRTFPTREKFISWIMQTVNNFTPTPMQLDAIRYIDEQTDHFMVQMPRGEGKTLITSINAIYELIEDPTCRVVVFSGNDGMSSEISKFILDIFHEVPALHFMLPDRRLGDKSSMDNFSICGFLKGIDKSPSIKCKPIFGGFEGIRADKIIADDLEMLNNSGTAEQRAKLRTRIQALEPLLDGSKPNQLIMILGTPQTTDSTYNVLPSLGFNIRIWTARVPSSDMIDHYNGYLAPYIQDLYDKRPELRTGFGMNGDKGAPTDPLRYDEEVLIRKEQTQTQGGFFDLQYMLCTKMSDADRYPLKVDKLLFMDLHETEAPISINPLRDPRNLITLPDGFSVLDASLYGVAGFSEERERYQKTVICIDPSGGGKTTRDEVGYAVVRSLNGYIYVAEVGGLDGGYKDENMEFLADLIGKYWSHGLALEVRIEDNFSYGMFRGSLQAVMRAKGLPDSLVEGYMAKGQKETRIISSLLPLITSSRLIFNTEIIRSDVISTSKYVPQERAVFSLFHQMRYITADRQSLVHDDRLDALAGALEQFAEALVVNQDALKINIDKQKRIDNIRRVSSPDVANVLLEHMGLVKAKGSGVNYLNYGRLKRNTHVKSNKNKSFHEKLRERQLQERRAKSRSANKGYSGKASCFYNR